MNTDQVTKLADAFRALLERDLEPEQLKEMDERNRAQQNKNICHSHDYLDANMTMHEAFKTVMGREVDMEDPGDLQLWGAAWTRMKEVAA